jgi:hypothetical protein
MCDYSCTLGARAEFTYTTLSCMNRLQCVYAGPKQPAFQGLQHAVTESVSILLSILPGQNLRVNIEQP